MLRPSLLARELVRVGRLQVPLSARACLPFSTSALSFSPSPSRLPFTFIVGQAFHGKPSDPSTTVPGPNGHPIPRPSQIVQGFAPDSPIARWRDEALEKHPWGGGHDWFFVADGAKGDKVVGVADGVGGWEDSGVNPAHFSQALMFYAKEEVVNGGSVDPSVVLRTAFEGVQNEPGVLTGSSTAVILSFDPKEGLLKAANLGDSTFLILRAGRVIHAEPSQTHFFNAPRQLAKLPAGKRQKGALVDAPEDAALYSTTLQAGDFVVVATDGFSDNVWAGELEQLAKLILQHQIRDSASDEETVQRLALACVNFARLCSFKEDKESPFEVEARRNRINYPGGKVDDVCVVAVLVQGAPQ